jgi:hypothetical protein
MELWGEDPIFLAYSKVLVSQVLTLKQATDDGTEPCICWLGARAVSAFAAS